MGEGNWIKGDVGFFNLKCSPQNYCAERMTDVTSVGFEACHERFLCFLNTQRKTPGEN